ncbi:MAG: hypothetical protein Q8L87_08310 [Anaerolineales bacterium]|jgi:hypothetical protein|nr:hypothetical protein [Anaerolineales bacterium]
MKRFSFVFLCLHHAAGTRVNFVFNWFLQWSLSLQRKVRLKATVPGGVLLENACAGDGAGSNLAL